MHTVVITGATTGLGLRTATRLAASGWHIVLGHRGQSRGQEAAERIRRQVRQASVEPMEIDLANLNSVAAAVRHLQRSGDRPPLHALLGNGGIQIIDGLRHSKDGYELTFATNHLGHHLLIGSLADQLPEGGRIVVVSSGTHDPAKSMGFPRPRWTSPAELAAGDDDLSPKGGRHRYTTSKLANLYFVHELARRLEATGITVNAYDPGLMPDTSLSRNYPAAAQIGYRLAAPLIAAAMPGARTSRAASKYLAALVESPRFNDTTGAYFEGPNQGESSVESHDVVRESELWNASEQLIGQALARRA
jgi:NAD(P)-dependent dehydrogenase (short-subunit alcohol dehydrogenase family)